MDYEALAFMRAHGIIPISYSSLSGGTDHPAVAAVAAAHKITPEQVLYTYVSQHNISVVSRRSQLEISFHAAVRTKDKCLNTTMR